jgi:subtilase family serine protease
MIKSARAMVAGLAAGGLILAGCASTPAGRPASGAPASPAGPSAGASAGATADCDSVTTCYTPGQIQVAYGIRPLLDRGIDGRGETVVLPEFAQTRLSPPQVSDIRQDLAQFDRLFGLPAARLRAVTTLAGAATPWLASQEEVADASGHSGMALAISDGGGRYAIGNSGGTSASAPLWAALIALAGQYAGRPLGFVNPALYRIARSAAYHRAFHDITTGNNTATWPPTTITGYRAGPGWDPVTGLGSPDAQELIPLLARYAGS